jgi:hypothetical protein
VWLVFCAAVAAYGLWLYPTEARALWAVLAVPLAVLGAGLLGATVLGLRGKTVAAVKALAAGTVLFFLSLVWWVLPEVDRYRPHREVAAAAAGWTRGDELRVAYRIPNSLVFYSGRTWRAYLEPEPVRRELCGAGSTRAVLLAPTDAAEDLGALVGQLRRLQELRGWVLLEKPQGRVLRCPSR